MNNRYTVIYKFRDGSTFVEQYLASDVSAVTSKIFNYLGSSQNGAMTEEEKNLIASRLFQFHSRQLLVPYCELINVWNFSAVSSAQIQIIKTALSISDH